MTDDLREHLDRKSTHDLVEILQEQNLEEWLPEVFPVVEELLKARGVDTAALKASGPPPHDTLEFGSLEVLMRTRTSQEAVLVRMALAQMGIKAWLSTEALAGVAPHLGVAIGIDVLVRPEDAAAAREFLARAESGAAAIPEEAEVCPECGSVDTGHLRTTNRISAVTLWALVGAPIPAVAWRWSCRSCGAEWD